MEKLQLPALFLTFSLTLSKINILIEEILNIEVKVVVI